MSSNNGKRRILTVAEATAEAKQEAAAGEPLIGAAGLKRNASKEYVLETATTIALGACERVYNAMSDQSAGQMATLEQEIKRYIDDRTFVGRLRRLWRWLRTPVFHWADLDGLVTAVEEHDAAQRAVQDEERLGIGLAAPGTMIEKVTLPEIVVCPECGPGDGASRTGGERVRYEYCSEHATIGP